MNWTKENPTRSGWYFWRHTKDIELKDISPYYVTSEIWGTYVTGRDLDPDMPIPKNSGEWFGPIKVKK